MLCRADLYCVRQYLTTSAAAVNAGDLAYPTFFLRTLLIPALIESSTSPLIFSYSAINLSLSPTTAANFSSRSLTFVSVICASIVSK